MSYKTTKQVSWGILQACMLWYEGADPEYYGFDREISNLGKKLADILFIKADKIYSKRIGGKL